MLAAIGLLLLCPVVTAPVNPEIGRVKGGCVDAVGVRVEEDAETVHVTWKSDRARGEVEVPVEDGVARLGTIACGRENVPRAELERGVVIGLATAEDARAFATVSVFGLDELRPLERRRRRPLRVGTVTLAEPEAPRQPTEHGLIALALVGLAIVVGARRGRAEATRPAIDVPAARVRRGG